MKIRQLPESPAMVVMRNELHLRTFSTTIQCISKLKQCNKSLLSDLLDRRWALASPESKINKISLSEMQGQHARVPYLTFSFSNNTRPSLGDHMMEKRKEDLSFYVVRDDLLHPLINERGLRSHLLLRGEQPEIPTGYNLISSMYGNVTYVERSLYGKREEMLMRHADLVAGDSGLVMRLSDTLETSFSDWKSEEAILPQNDCGSGITQAEAETCPRRVIIINEGAADAIGLFGVIRLVKYLSQKHLFGKDRPIKLVVDAGTGTTAVGLGLGALCLGLPWEVTAVMLADTLEGYKKQEERLISDFKRLYGFDSFDNELNGDGGIVNWVERVHPRKFGNVLKGEVEVCQQIAQQTGVLVDPVYTLAAWEHAALLCQREAKGDAEVVMLHTGGTLGMFGLAQRYKSYFKSLQQ
ncbi:D-cysteine desulfhydrase 2, mitochondrial isoform X4 [Magnolia sinica]|uniref:D-cysteine desulfhydrase 2, mitochondrial isoform X4 n=1 Tax=Magnolia sinica TaxID=86752 RepID=UPI0026586753|nr:D-cysteine desulfhydrase 2, mitochondrial isoform X4 [Magnolia sinica]